MKKWRLPRLSRGWKTIRNLTVALLWVVLLWGIMDYPISDPVGEFRRAERCCWEGPADIQRLGRERYGTVGTFEDQVLIQTGRYSLDHWPRSLDGPTLVPVENAFLAVDVPEGTAWAELRLELSFYYLPALSEPNDAGPTYAVRERAQEDFEKMDGIDRWRHTYVFQGERLKEGGVLFRAEPVGPEIEGELGVWDGLPLYEVTNRDIYSRDPWDNQAWAQMEAVFYGENGEELGRTALSTPKGGESDAP